MTELLIVNSMGLTGAEVLTSRLARQACIAFLPGQNFVQFGKNLYRPHDYAGQDNRQIFGILNKHLYQKDGRCWMGLTKNMTERARNHYDPRQHLAHFEQRNTSLDPLVCATNYTLAFYDTFAPARLAKAQYAGFWGGNHVLNAPAYAHSTQPRRVIDFTCAPATWLSNINARLTWNNLDALKFYLVTRLATRLQARSMACHVVSWEQFIESPDAVTDEVCRFLEIDNLEDDIELLSDAFIRLDAGIVGRTLDNAARYRAVYGADPLFRAAESFDQWSDDFLAQPGVATLLTQYARYWNSTFHTNFDFVGPVELQVLQKLEAFLGLAPEFNLNLWFYHDQFEMNSDTYQAPVVRLRHYLGCLEDDIVLPYGSYFIRCAIEYLLAVADNIALHQHSFIDLRTSALYRRLTSDAYRGYIQAAGHQARLDGLVRKIESLNTLEGA